jgi:hypothetical protein
MGKAFTDRWGVPVRAGSADAVALLDEAIAALSGDPVADAEAAAARQLIAENGGSPDALRW